MFYGLLLSACCPQVPLKTIFLLYVGGTGTQVGAKAEMMMGDIFLEAEEFQEAVHAYGRAEAKAGEEGAGGGEVLDQARQKLKDANVQLEQSKKKNYYKVV